MNEIPLKDSMNDYDKELICNGARPAWLSHFLGDTIDEFMKPYFDLDFEEAANIHDVNYFQGCNKKDKKIADKEFKKAMKRAIKKAGHSWLTRWFYYYKMYQYFKLVSWFGNSAFYFAKKKRTYLDLPSYKLALDPKMREDKVQCVWVETERRWYLRKQAQNQGLI